MGYKIKYQGGITKKICQQIASYRRAVISRKLMQLDVTALLKGPHNPYDVISFSGARDFEEQVLSIYSFVLNAGIPHQWYLYSDGTHTQLQKTFFNKKFPFIKLYEWDQFNESLSRDNRKMLEPYARFSPASKKVTLLSCHPYERQTIYADSDILFYEGAELFRNETALHQGFWFLGDIGWNTLESSAIRENETKPLNLGFIILNKNFLFKEVFSYLEKLSGNFSYFSDQTAFHNAFHQQHGKVLDPKKFILDVSDQFDFSTLKGTDGAVLRHYVTPVRHKMWQKNWYKI